MYARILILCLLALCGRVSTLAGDYVSDINSAAGNVAGHQVIYEMNVGSFTPSGTFAAAREQLGELKALGVDIVWLMPIYPRGTSGSPYAPTSLTQTNPRYGSVADLRALVDRAHELDMHVWLDWVPNHTATNAEWVTTHPKYYGWNGQQQWRHPSVGGITYNDVWQLNYYEPTLVNAMNDALKYWIDEADVDGFRCDYIASPQIPASYWEQAIALMKGYKEGKSITFLGETDIAQDVTRLKNVGFDYDYAWAFQSSLAAYGSAGTEAAPLKTAADKMLSASAGVTFGRLLYVTNHDQNWNESKKTLSEKYGTNRYALTVLAYTLYGMPLIYNGQETGGNQALDYFADTHIDWAARDDKMLNTLRTLTALKHAVPALDDRTAVRWVTLSPANSRVLAYTRKAGDSEVLVVLNMGTQPCTATLTGIEPGDWSLWLNSESIARGTSRKQHTLTASPSVSLDAKGYRVYVKGSFAEQEAPDAEVYVPTLDTSDEVSIFFETASADTYTLWAWGSLGGGEAYCTNPSWPGDSMTPMGQTDTGRYVYKCKLTRTATVPQYLIISKNRGNTKIYDGIAFVNHGYYVEGQTTPTQVITATSAVAPLPDGLSAQRQAYTLSGQQALPAQAGIVIRNGQKYFQK